MGTGDNANNPTIDGTISRSRGLTNLGNTCFFNSVMQGLTQSHPFTHLLLARNYCQKGTPFNIPAVELDLPTVPSRGQSPSESEQTDKVGQPSSSVHSY